MTNARWIVPVFMSAPWLVAQAPPAASKPDTPEITAKLAKIRAEAGSQWETAVHFWCEAPRANRPDDPLIPATRIFDNVYAIGNSGTTVYIVQTSAGLVMLDSLAANEGETQLLPGLAKLGLDPAQVKTILVAHGHGDHFGGSAYFQQKYDSRVYLAAADWALMERAAANAATKQGTPTAARAPAAALRRDGELEDGKPITVGDVTFTPVAIPGHTPGSMGFLFPVKENGRTHIAALFGGAWLTTTPLTGEVAATYLQSIAHFREATRKAKVDVALANHPLMMPFQAALDRVVMRREIKAMADEPNPFIVGETAYQKFLDVMQGCTELAMARKKLAAANVAPPQVFPQPSPAREVAVSLIPDVIAAGAKWEAVWQGSDNADGLVGTRDGSLMFAQEQYNRVSRITKNGKLSVYLADAHGPGALALDSGGRIVAVERTCTDPGRAGECKEPTAISVLAPARRVLASSVDGKSLGRLNDLVLARRGDIYFTSGGAFHMDGTGKVVEFGTNLRTNGIMLSRDEKTLYVTNGAAIVAFDVAADGTPSNQRDFAKLEGPGDGMAIDAGGRLYVTTPSGVEVVASQGKSLGIIPTPRNAISVAFGGPNKRMLYVVASGATVNGAEYVTPPNVRNNGKTIYRIPMVARGFSGRAK